MKRLNFLLLIIFLVLSCKKSDDGFEQPEAKTTTFTVIGDVPYGDTQRNGLIGLIEKHNAQNTSEFVVHVGDIKKGADPCNEDVFKDVSAILKKIKIPTFIILGDNEYNDCDNSEQAFDLWKSYFLKFNENWIFSHNVTYQSNRTENFNWIQEKILFIGLNIVGSSVHDANEWGTRLTENGMWVKQLLETHKNNIDATVIFSHANMVEGGSEKFKPFTDLFRAAAKDFDKPVLIINGDGHFWIKNNPWPEQNITRVQINGGADALKVSVNTDLENPFSFDNSFLD
ncbi:metallophosphoesterase [Aureibaculum sp. 2210JD6-5]|uniref:metallophosphoesterase n=1 Tax=Aureibaculum sp. 2210JD6-5 TaxID=3103957 RepID=UPI002AADBEB2|nr:metallophosphoesterase [Aureibaculum sp. 2210JD6-5]MDY7395610.1 metallophosphoesterase [Aureibaculum sp. 2210JD6-5]